MLKKDQELKNTGKNSEDIFESWVQKQSGYLYRFEDFYDAKKKGKVANRKPSDYLVTLSGSTFMAEVKSTTKNTFSFSNIQPEQWRNAIKITRAEGEYYFFIHLLALNEWFRVPARRIIDSAKKSINIKELSEYKLDLVL